MSWMKDGIDSALESEAQTNRDIELLMSTTLQKTRVSSQEVEFAPSLSWWGTHKTAKIGGAWEAKQFECTSVKLNFTSRGDSKAVEGKKMRNNKIVEGEECTSYEEYFDGSQEPMKDGFLWGSEKLSRKTQEFKGTLWLSEEFPLSLEKDVMPIVQLLAPSRRHFAKMQSFLEMKVPQEGFPVKMNMAVFPTVTGDAEFTKYEKWEECGTHTEALFEIPSFKVEDPKEKQRAEGAHHPRNHDIENPHPNR